MEENAQTQDEISLAYIFRLLLNKIKVLIVVLLAGLMAGAGLGVLRTFNKKDYGTTIEFYINPRLDYASSTEVESQYGVYGAYGRHVMDNMVKLLSSELFAEQLLLDEKTGLPKTGENAEVDALTAHALQAQDEAKTAVANAESALLALNQANTDYRTATTLVNTLWAQYRNAHPDKQLNSTPTETPGEDALNDAIQEQKRLESVVEKAEDDLQKAQEGAEKARNDAEETKEMTLALWRIKNPNYEKNLDLVINSIEYSYYDITTKEDVSDLARSFIYVKILVENDEDLANEFYKQIILLVPEFVKTNMPVPSGYDGTNCQRITRSDKIERTNKSLMTKTAIKYGFLLAAVATVVACVVVVMVDRSDKRIRNVEQLTETFNIPVLGVIPTIEKKEENSAEESTSNTEVKQ